jgi:hypothetical protein
MLVISGLHLVITKCGQCCAYLLLVLLLLTYCYVRVYLSYLLLCVVGALKSKYNIYRVHVLMSCSTYPHGNHIVLVMPAREYYTFPVTVLCVVLPTHKIKKGNQIYLRVRVLHMLRFMIAGVNNEYVYVSCALEEASTWSRSIRIKCCRMAITMHTNPEKK